MEEKTKLTLTIGDTTTSWEVNSIDDDFTTILEGFLGCMFGQTFVPGTEIYAFEKYLKGTKPLYADHRYNTDAVSLSSDY